MKLLTTMSLAVALTACSTPVTQVMSVDQRPTLSIVNAPKGSLLTIDGVAVGDAGEISSARQAIALNAGTHHIEVSLNGSTLLSEKIYLGEGLNKTLSAGVTR